MEGKDQNERSERAAGVIARTVSRAIHDALMEEELMKTPKGRHVIADGLHQFATRLSAERMDVSGILAVVGLLRGGEL